MKKPTTKKLALPSETIRHLTSVELQAVAGGGEVAGTSKGCSILIFCPTTIKSVV